MKFFPFRSVPTLLAGLVLLAPSLAAAQAAPAPASSVDEFGEPDSPPEPVAAPAASPQPAAGAPVAVAPAARAPQPALTAAEPAPVGPGRDPEPIHPVKARGGRPATTGFQGAFRLGFMFPGGRATGEQSDLLGSRYSWQVPFVLDLGVKPTEHIFVGTYMGFSLGAEGNDTQIEGYCDDDDDDLENDVSCGSHTLRIGLEVQYHVMPDQRWNPWIGYGFGFISASQSIDDRQKGRSEETTASGLTYAQISGGVDFRSALGVGPFGEVSVGRFNSTRTVIDNEDTFQGPIDDRAIHYWMTIGFRMVVRP